MGGAGAWHLGLHHPGAWCSVEAGAGFVDTKKYAKLDKLPAYQEKSVLIHDAVDYALNAFDVPIAGYGGEDDPQLRASVAVKEALEAAKVPVEASEITNMPNNTVAVDVETAQKVLKLIDALEDNDDVQNVSHNADIPESVSV